MPKSKPNEQASAMPGTDTETAVAGNDIQSPAASEITEPFIFKDAVARVYRAEPREGKWWLQSWNQAGGSWNDVHDINAEEAKAFSTRQISAEEAVAYAPKVIEPAGDQSEKGENAA